jgi:hypothetical protein
MIDLDAFFSYASTSHLQRLARYLGISLEQHEIESSEKYRRQLIRRLRAHYRKQEL